MAKPRMDFSTFVGKLLEEQDGDILREGVRVLAHDKFPDKQAMAERLGAIIPSNGDIARVWQAENVTTVFECAGATATVDIALSSVPRGGQVVLMGLATGTASFVPLRLVREEIRVSGSIIYDHPADFRKAIALVAAGTLRPRADRDRGDQGGSDQGPESELEVRHGVPSIRVGCGARVSRLDTRSIRRVACGLLRPHCVPD